MKSGGLTKGTGVTTLSGGGLTLGTGGITLLGGGLTFIVCNLTCNPAGLTENHQGMEWFDNGIVLPISGPPSREPQPLAYIR